MQVYSFSPFGYEGSLVSVEVDLRRGIPAVDIVGLADGAVKESRERMRSAIRNCGYEFPSERVLISLAPADLKKEGAAFDLAVALAVLCEKDLAEGKENGLAGGDILVMGELELNGRLRPLKGVHAAASTARDGGILRCIVPKENAEEAREIAGMKVFGATSLVDAYEALWKEDSFHGKDASLSDGNSRKEYPCVDVGGVLFPVMDDGYEFADIKGQGCLIRALALAAAGGHNLLAFGPPGCGKTLSIQKFPALLPLLDPEEARPVTRIYSIAGLLPKDSPLVRIAPFRQPHQTASIEGMCGGGPRLTPGEISLAHNGVLFLDEAAEFKSSVLQMLRVPLESGSITLSRAGRSTVFPACFQLLMATNPCPCGNFASKDRLCLCSSSSISMYWKKFSAPLLDRIDIRVHLDRQEDGMDCGSGAHKVSTEALRKDIARAVLAQRKRQDRKNARLSPSQISEFCQLSIEAADILDNATKRWSLSPRTVASCIKLSRTAADIRGKVIIDGESMSEALSFRRVGGLLEDLGMF
ncbi:MAG: YifB family Mg chelatase-like AAA ATPase [Treponema sp.]|nr:YifB family Mg chelatase-like AAA ATPase [Treponema sp.]